MKTLLVLACLTASPLPATAQIRLSRDADGFVAFAREYPPTEANSWFALHHERDDAGPGTWTLVEVAQVESDADGAPLYSGTLPFDASPGIPGRTAALVRLAGNYAGGVDPNTGLPWVAWTLTFHFLEMDLTSYRVVVWRRASMGSDTGWRIAQVERDFGAPALDGELSLPSNSALREATQEANAITYTGEGDEGLALSGGLTGRQQLHDAYADDGRALEQATDNVAQPDFRHSDIDRGFAQSQQKTSTRTDITNRRQERRLFNVCFGVRGVCEACAAAYVGYSYSLQYGSTEFLNGYVVPTSIQGHAQSWLKFKASVFCGYFGTGVRGGFALEVGIRGEFFSGLDGQDLVARAKTYAYFRYEYKIQIVILWFVNITIVSGQRQHTKTLFEVEKRVRVLPDWLFDSSVYDGEENDTSEYETADFDTSQCCLATGDWRNSVLGWDRENLRLIPDFIPARLSWPLQHSPREIEAWNWRPKQGLYGASRAGGLRRHKGVDLYAPIGTPVRAAYDGTVKEATDCHEKAGKSVKIEHIGIHIGPFSRNLLSTTYMHLSEIHVGVNQHVSAGDIIGLSGSTGDVACGLQTGLHFQVNVGNRVTNPLPWLGVRLIPGADDTEDDPRPEGRRRIDAVAAQGGVLTIVLSGIHNHRLDEAYARATEAVRLLGLLGTADATAEKSVGIPNGNSQAALSGSPNVTMALDTAALLRYANEKGIPNDRIILVAHSNGVPTLASALEGEFAEPSVGGGFRRIVLVAPNAKTRIIARLAGKSPDVTVISSDSDITLAISLGNRIRPQALKNALRSPFPALVVMETTQSAHGIRHYADEIEAGRFTVIP